MGHVDLIEDDDSLRESMVSLLHEAGFVVRSWATASKFLEAEPLPSPSVLITDMRMPGMTGLELHERLKAMGCEKPLVYISAESTPRQTIAAMKLGAHEFLIKPFSRAELMEAVQSALERDATRTQRIRDQLEIQKLIEDLAPREKEVMDLMVKGFSNAEIVTELGISLPTTKQYKTQIMRKLGLQSLSELMSMSQRMKPL